MFCPRLSLALAVLATLTMPASAPVWAQNEDDLDSFMAKVLERRETNWVQLHDYVLDEAESIHVRGPGGVSLYGTYREFTWYVKEGYLIRSPVRYDGVSIDEQRRRDYEARWLRQEQRRESEHARDLTRLSRRTTQDNIKIAIRRIWDEAVSETLVRRIENAAARLGDDQAAIAANVAEIVNDLGGVKAVGFKRAVAQTRDLFVMLEARRLEPDAVETAFNRILPELADSLDDVSDVDLDAFVELLTLAARFDVGIDDPDRILLAAEGALAASASASARLERVSEGFAAARRLGTGAPHASGPDVGSGQGAASLARLEPRFVSEAYFLDFEFEAGNYYFVGREQLAGREVVRIEY